MFFRNTCYSTEIQVVVLQTIYPNYLVQDELLFFFFYVKPLKHIILLNIL